VPSLDLFRFEIFAPARLLPDQTPRDIVDFLVDCGLMDNLLEEFKRTGKSESRAQTQQVRSNLVGGGYDLGVESEVDVELLKDALRSSSSSNQDPKSRPRHVLDRATSKPQLDDASPRPSQAAPPVNSYDSMISPYAQDTSVRGRDQTDYQPMVPYNLTSSSSETENPAPVTKPTPTLSRQSTYQDMPSPYAIDESVRSTKQGPGIISHAEDYDEMVPYAVATNGGPKAEATPNTLAAPSSGYNLALSRDGPLGKTGATPLPTDFRPPARTPVPVPSAEPKIPTQLITTSKFDSSYSPLEVRHQLTFLGRALASLRLFRRGAGRPLGYVQVRAALFRDTSTAVELDSSIQGLLSVLIIQEITESLTNSMSFLKQRVDNTASLKQMQHDFLYIAKTCGRMIISEVYLPDEQKTIKPIDLGGIAGGAKYISQGILFKFPSNTANIYSNYEGAAKVAGHEFKGNCAHS
jgi:hypothetical protein